MVVANGCTAFAGTRLIARGAPLQVALAVKAELEREGNENGAAVLVFDDHDARPVEFDLRGTEKDIEARIVAQASRAASAAAPNVIDDQAPDDAPRGRGRPKLGVVAREVTLLPRHWDWLGAQPGGASVVLRRLVDAARHASEARERVRAAQEAAHRFMTALAGNLPDYEEALRALYAGERSRFEAANAPWPVDVRDYARELAESAFA
ncbi:DUF2239 family protein [Paraburkholderia silvatlantica]|uniref:DUF2239 family protein n=1 Tax=Paraburkholderia silvatlantica TaxID=321895 RepID=A0ABR6FIJ8_9BURK|nr:DUF2239 family protein [Paraburkholderia silvatlantica]MBB2927248.1 hypothetical protein [Paraburkholderia silvatlantica]PVY36965.1 hypothetical protein C7411_102258 [Paraburkholderia silvatlantica]PXW41757.1 hypothetical protein C7413_102163 [Paraburkholderia silvatlantica]